MDGVIFQVYHNMNLSVFYLCLEPYYNYNVQYTLNGKGLSWLWQYTKLQTLKHQRTKLSKVVIIIGLSSWTPWQLCHSAAPLAWCWALLCSQPGHGGHTWHCVTHAAAYFCFPFCVIQSSMTMTFDLAVTLTKVTKPIYLDVRCIVCILWLCIPYIHVRWS